MAAPLSPEKRQRILELRAQGVGINKTARIVGVGTATVLRLCDPAYCERSRQQSSTAKRRRTGVCKTCGGPTRYNGHAGAGTSDECAACGKERQHEQRYWTRERVLEGIRRFAEQHGRPPVATEWLYGSHGQTGDGYPYASVVLREFGSWANAIEAAGFPRPTIGHNHRGTKNQPRISTDDLRGRLVAFHSEHGRAPASHEVASTYNLLRHRGLDWRDTLRTLGMRPLTNAHRRNGDAKR